MSFLSPKEYSEKIDRYYDMLAEDIRQEITKDDLAEYLASRKPKFEQRFEKDIREERVSALTLLDSVAGRARMKLSTLYSLDTVTPRDIDVMIAQALLEEELEIPRNLDPSEYATKGKMQSYDTLSSKDLFSTRSIAELKGDSVHFMMFASGATKIE